jgi:hypothetical protein
MDLRKRGSKLTREISPTPKLNYDPAKNYFLPELIDLAESHNPETRGSTYERSEPQPETADRVQAFVSLHRRIESLTSSLQKEIGNV